MKTGIVLEGGASRGVFTTGVLDTMMEKGLEFDYCIGVSAGAGNAMHLKSRQPGRAYDLLVGGEEESFYGWQQARKSGKLIDLDHMYHEKSYDPDLPFDFGAYYANPMFCEYVVSCCETGNSEYLHEDVYQKRLLDIVKASCSMPGITGVVSLDGKHYLDGGVTDPMPVERAFEMGCDKVVLVLTKPAANLNPTDYARLRPLMSRLYKRRYPEFYAVLMSRVRRYLLQMGQILEMERSGRIFVIRPSHCEISTLEQDREKLRAYYAQGCAVTREKWDAMMDYLHR